MKHKTCRRNLMAAISLMPLGLWAQMPPQPGKLTILSEPSGAIVTINGNKMNQPTNATFVVSAGLYTVSVASADKSLACPDTPLNVVGGQTVTRRCTVTGWQ
jgi:hypothetical protein